MELGIVSGFVLVAGLHACAGAANHALLQKPSVRMMPLVFSCAGLAVPFLLPVTSTGFRFLLALGAAMGVLRTIDLIRDPTPRTLSFRIQHIMTAFDTRRIKRGKARRELGPSVMILVFIAMVAMCIYLLRYVTPTIGGTPGLLARWAVGFVLAYASADMFYSGVTVLLRAVGFELLDLHRTPILSRTVKEFWGERWNRTVSAWFAEHLLRPLARHRMAKLGVLVSFVASAALHGYLVLASLGNVMALVMFGYFILQAVFVFIEMRLHANRWSPFAGHAWTVTTLVLSSPLFVEPALRGLGL